MRLEGRWAGEAVSDAGWDEGADEGFWKSLEISFLSSLLGVGDVAGGGVDEEGEGAREDFEETEDLPFG